MVICDAWRSKQKILFEILPVNLLSLTQTNLKKLQIGKKSPEEKTDCLDIQFLTPLINSLPSLLNYSGLITWFNKLYIYSKMQIRRVWGRGPAHEY